jgi:hypothetical protein
MVSINGVEYIPQVSGQEQRQSSFTARHVTSRAVRQAKMVSLVVVFALVFVYNK